MIDAHTHSGSRAPVDQGPALRQEIFARVFGVKARLDSVTVKGNLLLLKRQPLAGRNAQLPFDQIKSGNRLGHRMLDLQPRVHFEKVKFPQRIEQKLDGACIDVADSASGGDCAFAHFGSEFGRDHRRRGFLDHLLMTTLDRAIAFAKMDGVAILIGKHLYFDVPSIGYCPFDNQFVGSERTHRFGTRACKRVPEFLGSSHEPHPAATAARRGLDHERKTDARGFCDKLLVGLIGTLISRHTGNAGSFHQSFGARLVAHRVDRRGRRADEDETSLHAGLGKRGVLRKKPIARMNCVGTRNLRGA